MFLHLTNCTSNFSFTTAYFILSYGQFKGPQDVISLVSHCINQGIHLNLVLLLVKSGGTSESFETVNPFGPLLGVTTGEAFWWCYSIHCGNVLVLLLLYLCCMYAILSDEHSLVCFRGIEILTLTPWQLYTHNGSYRLVSVVVRVCSYTGDIISAVLMCQLPFCSSEFYTVLFYDFW